MRLSDVIIELYTAFLAECPRWHPRHPRQPHQVAAAATAYAIKRRWPKEEV